MENRHVPRWVKFGVLFGPLLVFVIWVMTRPVSDAVVTDFSMKLLVEFGYKEIKAFWIVNVSFVALVSYIIINAKDERDTYITIYREYELKLLEAGRLKLDSVTNYHSQYTWGSYASVTIGMVLLSVTMIVLNGNDLEPVAKAVQYWAVMIMSLASIMLVWADLLHTNSQTPMAVAYLDQS